MSAGRKQVRECVLNAIGADQPEYDGTATGMDQSFKKILSAARQITADYNLIEGNWRGADFLLIAFTMSAEGRCGDTLRV
jgi:hypothetical protein